MCGTPLGHRGSFLVCFWVRVWWITGCIQFRIYVPPVQRRHTKLYIYIVWDTEKLNIAFSKIIHFLFIICCVEKGEAEGEGVMAIHDIYFFPVLGKHQNFSFGSPAENVWKPLLTHTHTHTHKITSLNSCIKNASEDTEWLIQHFSLMVFSIFHPTTLLCCLWYKMSHIAV